MTACPVGELGDDELADGLEQAGVGGVYGRHLVDTRDQPVSHDVLHQVLEGQACRLSRDAGRSGWYEATWPHPTWKPSFIEPGSDANTSDPGSIPTLRGEPSRNAKHHSKSGLSDDGGTTPRE